MKGTVIQEAGVHEGEELRKYLRQKGFNQEDFAENILGKTPQNLSYHMRKRKLSDDFKRLLKEKGIHLFSEIENKIENEAQSDQVDNTNTQIPYNIQLKQKRLAQLRLPKDAKKEDLNLVIEYLQLMLKSME